MSQAPKSWSNVDQSQETQSFINYLDMVRTNEVLVAAKRLTFEALSAPGRRLLDVGCGAGDDAIELAGRVGPTGSVLGLDYSEAMVAEARKRAAGLSLNVEFRQGNAMALDLPDASFDGARADRVFQHLAEAPQALAELVRVVRPGGVVVVSDPDYGSFMFDSDHKHLMAKANLLIDNATVNGWSGRRLPGLFRDAGLADVSVNVMFLPLSLAFVRASMSADLFKEMAVKHGLLTSEEADTLNREMDERDASGRWFAGVSFFIVTGRRP